MSFVESRGSRSDVCRRGDAAPGGVPEADDVLLLLQVPDDAGAVGVAARQDVLHLPVPRQAADLRLPTPGAGWRTLAHPNGMSLVHLLAGANACTASRLPASGARAQ